MQLDDQTQAVLYALIGRLLLVELDEPTRAALLEPDVLQVLDRLEPGCADYLSGEWDAAAYQHAASEYAGLLLVGHGLVNPRASSWLGTDGLVLAIEDLIESTEPDLAPDHFGNAPRDHLGVLASFVAGLFRSPNPQARAQAPGLVHHLLRPWVPSFCLALRDRTCNPLYRAVARLLDQLVLEADLEAH